MSHNYKKCIICNVVFSTDNNNYKTFKIQNEDKLVHVCLICAHDLISSKRDSSETIVHFLQRKILHHQQKK